MNIHLQSAEPDSLNLIIDLSEGLNALFYSQQNNFESSTKPGVI